MVDALNAKWPLALIYLIGILLQPIVAYAEDDWGDDGDEIGFADTPDIDVPSQGISENLKLKTLVRSRAGFWLERLEQDSVSTLRQSLDIDGLYKQQRWRLVVGAHLEYDPAYTVDDARYDAATLDVYTWRYLPREQYLSGQFGVFDLTFGQQVAVWGVGDVFSPLDLINPRDLREPGLADLDDIRLPLLMTRIGAVTPVGRFELILTHEAYFGEQPTPLGEYSPFRALLKREPTLASFLGDRSIEYAHLQTGYRLKDSQIFGRWSYNGTGYDLGLYAAWARDRQGVLRLPTAFGQITDLLAAGLDLSALPGVPNTFKLELDHRRFIAMGSSLSTVFGSFVLKGELVLALDQPYNSGDAQAMIPAIQVDEATMLTGMAGLTYSGFRDTVIGLEWQRTQELGAASAALFPITALQSAVRISRTFSNEDIRLDAAATAVGVQAQYGWLARSELGYVLRDNLQLAIMYVHYGAGSSADVGPFYGLDQHDQLWLKLRWAVQLI